MKKYKSILISILLVVFGIIGILFCAIPHTSKEQKIVNKYIKAINNCDIEELKDCYPLKSTNIFSDDYEKIFNSYSDRLKTKLDYIEMSGLSVCDKLPEEVKEIKNISLVSINNCSDDESFFSTKTFTVDATIKVEYISEEDEIFSFTAIETFQLVETGKGYKIVSV